LGLSTRVQSQRSAVFGDGCAGGGFTSGGNDGGGRVKPLVIDLCCGLGGWTRGFLSEGWEAIGFDIEKHEYGDKRYPGELILRDITTLCGYDLRCVNPALVVASPPCQKLLVYGDALEPR